MLTFKRLLLIVTTLLCALSIAACSSPSTTNAQAAAANSSNSGVSTSNEIAKESLPSQASKQASNNIQQTSDQMSNNQNQGAQASAQISNSVNNSQQIGGQTTIDQKTQDNNKQQNNMHNDQNKATNNADQNSHTSSNADTSSNVNNSENSNNSSGTNTYVKVAQVSINGQMTNVLTTGNGMTLYYDTNDSSMNATCTGSCAQTWPPFLAQGQLITSNGITSGSLTEHATANGNQVEYNGHPLYTYVNDTAAGQVNGQGANNVWYAASMVTTQSAHW